MRNIPLRIGKHFRPRLSVNTPRTYNVPQLLRPAKQFPLHGILQGSTTKSLRTFLQALRSRTTLINRAVTLSQFGLSVDEYRLWRSVLLTPNFSEAVSMIEKRSFRVGMSRPEERGASVVAKPPMPSWVLLSIVCYGVVNSKNVATKMEELVFSYLPDVPSDIQGPLLLAAANHFGHLNFLVPLRRTVQAFLYIDLEDPALQFNQMLKAIARISNKSIEGANLVIQLLQAMRSRQLQLYSPTYDILLKDRFVTLQLTKSLRQEMIDSGHTPTAQQLEAYLRIFAKDGAIHDAGKYYEAIQRESVGQSRAESALDHDNPIHRANTLFLRGQSDRASAFHFLRQLSGEKQTNDSAALNVPTTASDSAGQDQQVSVSPPSGQASHAPPNSNAPCQVRNHKHRRAHFAVPPDLYNKPLADAYDYSAAFIITARDRSISVKRLVALFNAMPVRPTIATYTVLLTALLRRGEVERAEIYWQKLVASGLRIDALALSSGLTILTRLNKVQAAFDTLQAFAGDAKKGYTAVSLRAAGSVTTALVNGFMVALNRVGRPDVVFRLWDYMEHLYNVQPDSTTLSIALRSTRLACKLDDSLSGNLTRLSLKLPFRKASLHNLTRLEMSTSITVTIGPRKAESKYRSALWDQKLPLEAARLNFHRAIFSNAHYEDLISVKMPTAAVHTPNQGGMLSFTIGLPKVTPIKPHFFDKDSLFQPSGKSYFPQIAITDTNFMDYITLIGVNGLASEIPLTLAWMRILGVYPSTATIALALVFWSEVSMHAPLIVSWVGGPAGNNYTKLVTWLRDWVGETSLPSPMELLKWQRIVNEMKNT